MKNALLPGFGGPMGRHARPTSRWFDPLFWSIAVATLLYLVLALRHVPCIQTDATVAPNAFVRLCYSDIPLAWGGQGFNVGRWPMSDGVMSLTPVMGLVLRVVGWISGLLGAPTDAAGAYNADGTVNVQLQIDGSVIFTTVMFVLLFLCFIAWVASAVHMGAESRNGTRRSWDAMLVAAAPVVLMGGLVSWDLLPIALCAVGLLLFARRRMIEAGVLLGVAAATGTMAIAVVLVVIVCTMLRGSRADVLRFSLPAVGIWLAIHAPLILNHWDTLLAFYRSQITTGTAYGSIWMLLDHMGVKVLNSGTLGFLIMLVFLIALTVWLFVARKRPRIGSLLAGVIIASVLAGGSYAPQTSLWVLFALVLARPKKGDWLAFTITEVAYQLAVWAYIDGTLTAAKNGPENLYYLAIGARVAVHVYLLVRCLIDIARPKGDTLRLPDHSDPIGGVLVDGEEMEPLTREELVSAS